jgi:hypothetical protein
MRKVLACLLLLGSVGSASAQYTIRPTRRVIANERLPASLESHQAASQSAEPHPRAPERPNRPRGMPA